jgi:hypothetical protein
MPALCILQCFLIDKETGDGNARPPHALLGIVEAERIGQEGLPGLGGEKVENN